MRTVKLIWSTRPDAATSIQLETEVVVDEQADPHEAGAEAVQFLIAFQAGVVEGAQANE